MTAVVMAGAGRTVPVGCPVLDVHGAEGGTLAGVDAHALVVRYAIFLKYRIPFAAVADFDGEALRLTVTKAAVRRGEWDAGY